MSVCLGNLSARTTKIEQTFFEPPDLDKLGHDAKGDEEGTRDAHYRDERVIAPCLERCV